MGKILADISMSLDGFVTGPHPDHEHGLGRGGESLHDWAFCKDDPVDAQVLTESTARTGAIVMGRRTFDLVDGPGGWEEDAGYVPGIQGFRPPAFVVTHRVPASIRLPTQFTIVTEGLEIAIRRAQVAANGQNVAIMGGGDVIRQSVRQGLADELRVHLVPVLLGSGTRLFEGGELQGLDQARVQVSSRATHLTYRIREGS